MSLQKLISKINHRIRETTDSGAIAYIAGGHTSMRKTVSSLLKHKSDWKIEILEQGEDYHVSFEDKLRVIVPKLQYAEFNEKVIKIDGLKVVTLEGLLQEAIELDFTELTHTLTTDLRSVPVMQRSVSVMNSWFVSFPNSRAQILSPKTLINLKQYDLSVAYLVRTIAKQFKGDKGYLERVVTAIQDNAPLSGLDLFNSYKYLGGVRIRSNYLGSDLEFRIGVNLAMKSEQLIIMDDMEAAAEMSYYKEVKVLKTHIYPVQGEFRPHIFESIKDVIEALPQNKE